jgi:hypothetical protein
MEGTIILRFRDLVTAPGNTVREHSELIDLLGYTWWGWWRRPYEAVPYALFTELTENLPGTIFLLDTGGRDDSLQLYRATLADIAVTPSESDIASPDVSATPRYYNNARFAAWFKLTEISLTPDDTVKSVRVLGLPTWPKQAEADAGGTIGSDISMQKQLRNFDVTLWHIATPPTNSAR